MSVSELFSRRPIAVRQKAPEPAAEDPMPYARRGDSAQQAGEREARTVFVGNVASDTDKKAVLRLFRPCGAVEKLWVRSVPVEQDSALPVKAKVALGRHSAAAKAKNFYVLFKEPSAVDRAVALNGSSLDGRHLHVTAAGRQDRDFRTTVFVGNLAFTADEEELWAHFGQCGEVRYVRVVRDRHSHEGKGFAYVSFAAVAAVANALQLDGQPLAGRELRVSKAKKRFARPSPAAAAPAAPSEDFAETALNLAQRVKAHNDTYDEAQMNNVFKHQAVVPASRYKKALKRAKGRSGGAVEPQRRVKRIALQALNKEYFETDDLLKIRREKRKMKKKFNKANTKKVMKATKTPL